MSLQGKYETWKLLCQFAIGAMFALHFFQEFGAFIGIGEGVAQPTELFGREQIVFHILFAEFQAFAVARLAFKQKSHGARLTVGCGFVFAVWLFLRCC